MSHHLQLTRLSRSPAPFSLRRPALFPSHQQTHTCVTSSIPALAANINPQHKNGQLTAQKQLTSSQRSLQTETWGPVWFCLSTECICVCNLLVTQFSHLAPFISWFTEPRAAQIGFLFVCEWGMDKEGKSEMICLFVCVCVCGYLCMPWQLYWCDTQEHSPRCESICKHKTVRRYIFKRAIDDTVA